MISTQPAIMMGKSMEKILLTVLVLQLPPSCALPVSNPLDADADGSVAVSEGVLAGVLDSNKCVRKWNTTITGSDGRHPEGEVQNADQCSSACKEDPTCETFLYQEDDSNCTLFLGNATIVEQSGNGTVGYCLSEGPLKNCHLKLRFKVDEDNSMRWLPTFANT